MSLKEVDPGPATIKMNSKEIIIGRKRELTKIKPRINMWSQAVPLGKRVLMQNFELEHKRSIIKYAKHPIDRRSETLLKEVPSKFLLEQKERTTFKNGNMITRNERSVVDISNNVKSSSIPPTPTRKELVLAEIKEVKKKKSKTKVRARKCISNAEKKRVWVGENGKFNKERINWWHNAMDIN